MKATFKKNMVILRVDRGENVVDTLKRLCSASYIKAAQITGIGATDSFMCGVFNPNTKEYKEIGFEGMYEILSIVGNITDKDGEPYIHAHICVSDEYGKAFGGHLIEAHISVTCEIILTLLEGEVNREYNDIIGINILDL